MSKLPSIQLFRERLSYKRGKANATMSKVTMGNGGFYGHLKWIWTSGVSAWWKKTAQSFSFLVAESPFKTSIKQSLTLTTYNANWHCRACFYTFVGQPLLKQLYLHIWACMYNDSWPWWLTERIALNCIIYRLRSGRDKWAGERQGREWNSHLPHFVWFLLPVHLYHFWWSS